MPRFLLDRAGSFLEAHVFGEETTGAEADIRQAAELARNMVGLWA